MPDILIGNIRGPQGETGPANQVLAQTYDYCVSDNGETIPTGPWSPTLPELHQGDWVWARCTITMEQGADVVMYAVGYVGRDGEFNGIELVNGLNEKITALENRTTPISKGGTESTTLAGAQARLGITALQEALDKINDYTTGINLVRGAKDFRAGIEDYRIGFKRDGFAFTSDPGLQIDTDADGFGVLSITNGSPKGIAHAFITSDISPNEVFTVSFEFMFDDVSSLPESYIVIVSEYGPSSTTWNGAREKTLTPSLSDLGYTKSSIMPGKWYKAVFQYTASANASPDNPASFLGITFSFPTTSFTNGTIHYRKLDANRGSINNPIWSESPFDGSNYRSMVGVNLLHGTRDYVIGTQAGIGNTRLDGFYQSSNSYTFYKDDEGFTVAHIEQSGLTSDSAKALTASVVNGIKPGDTFTFSFEVMVDNVSQFNTSNFANIQTMNSSGTVLTTVSTNFADSRITPVSGKWYRINIFITIPTGDAVSLKCNVRLQRNGSINFRKECLYPGIVENPEWSASPFDVAQQADLATISSLVPSPLGAYRSVYPVIGASDDVNNYVTPGVYAVNPNAANNQLKATGQLTVSYPDGTTSYVRQVLSSTDIKATTYHRIYTVSSKTFTPWEEKVTNKSIVPIEMGGHGANTLAGAKQNLGITALEARVAALESYL